MLSSSIPCRKTRGGLAGAAIRAVRTEQEVAPGITSATRSDDGRDATSRTSVAGDANGGGAVVAVAAVAAVAGW